MATEIISLEPSELNPYPHLAADGYNVLKGLLSIVEHNSAWAARARDTWLDNPTTDNLDKSEQTTKDREEARETVAQFVDDLLAAAKSGIETTIKVRTTEIVRNKQTTTNERELLVDGSAGRYAAQYFAQWYRGEYRGISDQDWDSLLEGPNQEGESYSWAIDALEQDVVHKETGATVGFEDGDLWGYPVNYAPDDFYCD